MTTRGGSRAGKTGEKSGNEAGTERARGQCRARSAQRRGKRPGMATERAVVGGGRDADRLGGRGRGRGMQGSVGGYIIKARYDKCDIFAKICQTVGEHVDGRLKLAHCPHSHTSATCASLPPPKNNNNGPKTQTPRAKAPQKSRLSCRACTRTTRDHRLTPRAQWKQDANIREIKVIRRYHIQNREDYHKSVTRHRHCPPLIYADTISCAAHSARMHTVSPCSPHRTPFAPRWRASCSPSSTTSASSHRRQNSATSTTGSPSLHFVAVASPSSCA